MTKHKQAIFLFFLAVLSELFILTDSLAIWISRLITSNIVSQGIISFPLTYIFWICGILVIHKLYKNSKLISFGDIKKPTAIHFLLGLLLLAVSFTISYISWDGFKVAKELMGGIRNGGIGLGIAYFIAQYIYYFLEVVLFFNIIKYSQQAGELLFKNKFIPYGGIALAVLWGLAHIIFHGAIDGLTTTLLAVIMGTAYLAMRKSTKYTFVLILLMFIL